MKEMTTCHRDHFIGEKHVSYQAAEASYQKLENQLMYNLCTTSQMDQRERLAVIRALTA